MDMQNVSNLQIPEGAVRRLIWGRLAYDTKYVGNTIQNGTPAPDTPIAIQTVTGEQTITISDGIDSEAFPVSLGSLELCKIGDYQDYIYKSGDDWYVHKEVGVFDLSAGTYVATTGSIRGLTNAPNIKYAPNNQTIGSAVTSGYRIRQGQGLGVAGVGWFAVDTSRVNFNTGSSTNPVGTLYYALAAFTDTRITDATLITQLDAVHQWLTRYGYNATVSGDLPIVIDRTNL